MDTLLVISDAADLRNLMIKALARINLVGILSILIEGGILFCSAVVTVYTILWVD